MKLDYVHLMYVSNGRIMLSAVVNTVQLSETQALASIILDPTISDDVRLTWSYIEQDSLCPESQPFVYRFSDK